MPKSGVKRKTLRHLAGVITHVKRKGARLYVSLRTLRKYLPDVARSHAPAWERILGRSCVPFATQERRGSVLPRRIVGASKTQCT